MVALLAEGVDRNRNRSALKGRSLWVALLAEGVDRNDYVICWKTDRIASPSSRRAWIEIDKWDCVTSGGRSPSSRRAWIEIPLCENRSKIPAPVALLAEGVDRNLLTLWSPFTSRVVALLAEGVDRNMRPQQEEIVTFASPSSRRAWIEIPYRVMQGEKARSVALLAEGVDRNSVKNGSNNQSVESPSSRRAWIEMERKSPTLPQSSASPSSRRAWIEISLLCQRSPSSEQSPSSRRAWIEII